MRTINVKAGTYTSSPIAALVAGVAGYNTGGDQEHEDEEPVRRQLLKTHTINGITIGRSINITINLYNNIFNHKHTLPCVILLATTLR